MILNAEGKSANVITSFDMEIATWNRPNQLWQTRSKETTVVTKEFPRDYEGCDRLCGLVIRVAGYRSRDPGSIPGATRFSDK
jgi:hypothetical protein